MSTHRRQQRTAAKDREDLATASIRVVVLLVGVSSEFLERFRVAAAPRMAAILACEPATLERVAAQRLPRTLVVPPAVYAAHRPLIDRVAGDACARVVEVGAQDVEGDALDQLVSRAVRWA